LLVSGLQGKKPRHRQVNWLLRRMPGKIGKSQNF